MKFTFPYPNYVILVVLLSVNTKPRGYKTLFMLNITEQEISTAHKN